ncbi:MAG TPA: hypothetical protein VJ868_06330 [Actinomycetota bacterium]|nr:hypothetical protein [Actinomycetota bacterium]
MQADPNLEGAVAVDHRGERFALGRTSDSYAVWPLSGGAPIRTFPQEERYWGEAWQAFQALEAAPPEAAGTAGAVEAPEPDRAVETAPAPDRPAETDTATGEPEGVVVMDYRGTAYGVGRTRDAYAIWDVARGGRPLEFHPLTEEGWQAAWHRYQELEAGGQAPGTEVPPGVAPGGTDEVPVAGGDLRGAGAVDYRGRAYALGRTAGGYAIWDTITGGDPILTFPPTPEAWNQAWGAYQRLERASGG